MSWDMYRCGCEQGGDCTKTTHCAIQSAVEDREEQIELLRKALDDAIAHLRHDLYRGRVPAAIAIMEDALEQTGGPYEPAG